MMKNNKFTFKKLIAAVSVIAVLAVTGLFSFEAFSARNTFALPENVSFGVWHPVQGKTGYDLVQQSLEYDEKLQTLTFVLEASDGGKLTFSEQAVPESVPGQPDLFDVQLKSLPEVAKFESVNGQVSVTHPTASDKATAIMRSKGTLVLVHSDKTMTTDKWRTLFNNLEIKI